jgi:anaerobic magnesium-protoporphyrin IX monomethyl ester cyclase
MRYSRVLLVSPPSSSYLGAARPPQNLGYLAQALLENGIEYDILDMRLGYKWKHLVKKIESFQPDIVGVTVVSLEYKKTYELISTIKEHYPDVKTVVGGPHVTVLQEDVLEECPAIDFGVVYEGEATLVELCQDDIPVQEIKGLLHRLNGAIVYNGHRAFPKNLDDISFPKYEKFEINKYIREMPFNSSRGCPLKCIFCPNKMITKKFRWRSAKNVVDEIEYWYNRDYRVFNYDDDNFTFFNDRVYEICDEIENRGIQNVELRCSNGIRADRVNRKLLRRMREVGFNYIAFGVDGGNNKMLKYNKKGETIEQIELAIKDACELGFDVKIFVITGMPHETMEDIEDSLRLVKRYPIKRVVLNNPVPYPGTELFDIVKENGWFIKQPEEYLNVVTENEDMPVFETPELSYDDRLKILKRCRKIEKAVTRKAVQRMYKKYFFLGTIAGVIFASNFMQRMFFENMMFRRFVEYIRYRRTLAKKKQLAAIG